MSRIRASAAALFVAPLASYTYARYGEKNWIQTNRITLNYDRLPEAFSGIRVLLFSDLHLGHYFSAKQLVSLKDRINAMEPDLVCFTGDLFDKKISERIQVAQILQAIKAPLGKFAVMGNHDYYSPIGRVRTVWKNGGFTLLVNQSSIVRRNGELIQVAGVDDMVKGKPDIEAGLEKADPNVFTILLSHAPDFADRAYRYPVDLQLSGHSHGGQVRLPLIGHLTAPLYGRKYVAGLYALGEGEFKLYTNRGIGVSVYPIRFCCRPEITLFTLDKKG